MLGRLDEAADQIATGLQTFDATRAEAAQIPSKICCRTRRKAARIARAGGAEERWDMILNTSAGSQMLQEVYLAALIRLQEHLQSIKRPLSFWIILSLTSRAKV